ncbi:hypothetical protein QEN19_000614 [Hanseniaspora menglaensis]
MSEEEIDYESLPSSAPLTHQLAAGAFAGIMEHSIMFPLDAVKTRMQAISNVNGSSSVLKNSSSSLIKTISTIATQEGSMALWKGVQSMVMGAGPAHAVYFATYEAMKENITTFVDESSDSKESNTSALKLALITGSAGVCATIAADALMNPFDTIKQRMQLHKADHPGHALEKPVPVKKTGMWYFAKKIYKNEGFLAFYYSYPTTLAMNVPFAALNFSIYELSTQYFNPAGNYNPWIHSLCGAISGAICAAVTTPLDCIKTVLQVRGSHVVTVKELKEADSFFKAAKAIKNNYGWAGFSRGLKPRIISNMPAAAISWTAYECAKYFFKNYE